MALFITILATPLIKSLATRHGIVDNPGGRKIHAEPIPKIGGLAIFIGIFLSMGILGLIYPNVWNKEIFIIFLGACAVVGLGLLDDIYTLQAPIKLLGQVIIASCVVLGGLEITYLTNPISLNLFALGNLSKPISILLILILMNTINLIDGLDGLASGITAISALSLFIISLILGQLNAAFLLIALSGAAFGFLRFNFNPASIFMGDTGSLLLGYLLAVSAIAGLLKSSVMISLAIPMLSLLIPLADTFFAIIRRTKRGVHIFKADAEHIHHKLLFFGFTHKEAVVLIYYATVILNIMAIALSLTSGIYSLLLTGLILAVIIYAYQKLRHHMAME